MSQNNSQMEVWSLIQTGIQSNMHTYSDLVYLSMKDTFFNLAANILSLQLSWLPLHIGFKRMPWGKTAKDARHSLK